MCFMKGKRLGKRVYFGNQDFCSRSNKSGSKSNFEQVAGRKFFCEKSSNLNLLSRGFQLLLQLLNFVLSFLHPLLLLLEHLLVIDLPERQKRDKMTNKFLIRNVRSWVCNVTNNLLNTSCDQISVAFVI